MSPENAKKLAHELTMEYLKANPEYLRHTRDEAQKNGKSNCRGQ